MRDHGKLRYNLPLFLLALAFSQRVLFGYQTPEELWEQQIPDGESEVLLRFNDEDSEKPVLRTITMANGISEKPLTRAGFCPLFRAMLENAGYFGSITIHALRRGLSNKVDSEQSRLLTFLAH